MGFAHPSLNNINTGGRRRKKSKQQLVAEAEHRKFLEKMGVPMGRKIAKPEPDSVPSYSRTTTNYPSLMTNEVAVAAKAEPKVYSGERRLLGVATMHKSNMVPVFADKKEDAIEIAKMRR